MRSAKSRTRAAKVGNSTLYAWEMGAIYEGQRDFDKAVPSTFAELSARSASHPIHPAPVFACRMNI